MSLEINGRIKKYRRQKGLTQKETAELLDIKHSTYAQMERKGGIKTEMAIKLAEIFGVNPDHIIYGEGNELFGNVIPPKPLIVRTPDGMEKIYQNPQPEPKPEPKPEMLNLTALEENIIKIYRDIKNPKERQEFIDYVQGIYDKHNKKSDN